MKPDQATRNACKLYEAVVVIGCFTECYPDEANEAREWLNEYRDDCIHAVLDDPDHRCAKTELEMIKAIQMHMAVCYAEHCKQIKGTER